MTVVAVATLAICQPAALGAQALQRSMYVSVLDQAGAPVPTLTPSDVTIREDNVAREILRVSPATEPLQIALLVDNSQMSADYMRDIRKGVEAFITQVLPTEPRSKNVLSLIALAGRPTIVADATSDPAPVLKAAGRLFAERGSGNYLLDGIIEVTKGFQKRGAERPVIVAITTDGPEFSSRHFDLVLTPLQSTGASLHAFVVGPLSNDIGDDARNRQIVIDEGTRRTGGRRETLLTSMPLADKLSQLASELTHQYRVTYAPRATLIPPERVTVNATQPGFVARGTLIREQGRP